MGITDAESPVRPPQNMSLDLHGRNRVALYGDVSEMRELDLAIDVMALVHLDVVLVASTVAFAKIGRNLTSTLLKHSRASSSGWQLRPSQMSLQRSNTNAATIRPVGGPAMTVQSR